MTFRPFLLLSIFLSIQTWIPSSVFSHPHVFIVHRYIVVFDTAGLAGLRVNWRFDEFFTQMILEDYDRNQNNRLEPREVETIEKEAFRYLENYDYFTFIKINQHPFKVKYVRDFNAFIHKGKLVYEFFVPCHVRAIDTFKMLRAAAYDPTYYSAIFFAKHHTVRIENGERFETTVRVDENKQETYYYDMIHPWEMTLKFRLKGG